MTLSVTLFTVSAKHFSENKAEYWKLYFDYNSLETATKKFDHSINTDGVSVSFSMKKTETVQANENNDDDDDDDAIPKLRAPNLREIRDRFAGDEYGEYVALDPGRRLMVGGLSRATANANGECTHLKVKSSRFHHATGELNFFNAMKIIKLYSVNPLFCCIFEHRIFSPQAKNEEMVRKSGRSVAEHAVAKRVRLCGESSIHSSYL